LKENMMVALTTGVMSFLFTCVEFLAWIILRRWPACAPTAYEGVAIAEILETLDELLAILVDLN
jgi:hypothetical protein